MTVFKVTGAAIEVLNYAINKEKSNDDEMLFVRLSMGIG
jgi:hypothetical protein